MYLIHRIATSMSSRRNFSYKNHNNILYLNKKPSLVESLTPLVVPYTA